ncbi:MAG TPA: TonB family protein [Candidatus Sulfotelmatobacter sp.]|nr:TonB family protein [Candidatus Sulfotelmatobacter sp.]
MSKPEDWKSWEGVLVDGKFPLLRWLGGSDKSAVFLTERHGRAGNLAIKLTPVEATEEDSRSSQLRGASQLSHPHLLKVYESGRCRINGISLIYAVMEYADEDLSQILPLRALTSEEVSEMLPPVLDALSYLHARGLVHGRVKPSNVLVVQEQLKLSADQAHSFARTSTEKRRRDDYDAPETAAGIFTPASDVWSLGVTLIAALTQNVSLKPDGSQADPGLPAGMGEPFRSIARDCLHLDPKQRCSLTDVRARLQLPRQSTVPIAIEKEREREVVATPPGADKPSHLLRTIIPVGVLLACFFGWLIFRHAPPTTATDNTPANVPAPSEPSPAPTTPAPATSAPVPVAQTTKGAVIHQVVPDVSKQARDTITGTIKVGVRVEVNNSGKVTSAALKSSGPSRYFSGLALQAAKRWEFSAPQINGQPKNSEWLLQFRFKRSGTQASSQPLSR